MRTQYGWVTESRAVLLQFCESVSPDHLIMEDTSFGRGSVRNLLVHIANTYEYWIGKNCLQKDLNFTPYGTVINIRDVRILFSNIDRMIDEFNQMIEVENTASIPIELDSARKNIDPFKLFTHVITHEFHHKGQILSLCRHLGYIPVDTDIMR